VRAATTFIVVVFPEVIIVAAGCVEIVGVAGRALVKTVVEPLEAAEFP
jgi:hypothetical protein